MVDVTEERRWVSISEFAAYLGVSSDTAYRLAATDPTVKRYVRRFGRRVLVCLYAWKHGEEDRMAS